MTRFPNQQQFRLLPLNRDRFLMGDEGFGTSRREIPARLLRIDAFDKHILDINVGAGDAPGETVVAAENYRRKAGGRRAGKGALRSNQTRQIPSRGQREGQMRIVGEDRGAGLGPGAGYNPSIRSAARCAGAVRHGSKRASEHAIVNEPLKIHFRRNRRRARGLIRPQVGELRCRQPVRQARAKKFIAPIDREPHRHQLKPDQRIGGRPRLGRNREQQEIRRQRAIVGTCLRGGLI